MRRLVIVPAAIIVLLASAVPALAAAPPRIHENGTVDYASAYFEECNRSGCSVIGINWQLDQDGAAFVCIDEFGRRQGFFNCGEIDPSAVTITDSSATLDGIVLMEVCDRQGCTLEEFEVSAELVVTGDYSPYSSTGRWKDEFCTERYQVRGERAPAEGSFSINRDEFTALFGTVGSETYNFSTTCVFPE